MGTKRAVTGLRSKISGQPQLLLYFPKSRGPELSVWPLFFTRPDCRDGTRSILEVDHLIEEFLDESVGAVTAPHWEATALDHQGGIPNQASFQVEGEDPRGASKTQEAHVIDLRDRVVRDLAGRRVRNRKQTGWEGRR